MSGVSETRNKRTVEECQDLKDKGNACISQNKYEEAVINYTFAMDNFPANEMYVLYSNRSLALLKVEQYYFALQDAEKTIELAPNWAKGYLRKGEVQFHVGLYSDAIKSYNQARVWDPSDKSIPECIKKANRQLTKISKEAVWRPWLFTASSLVIGFILIIAEHFFTQLSLLQYTVFKLLILTLFGCGGYTVSRIYQYNLDNQVNVLLEEPPDFCGMKSKPEVTSNGGDHSGNASAHKGHKSQSSRHRHRRGR